MKVCASLCLAGLLFVSVVRPVMAQQAPPAEDPSVQEQIVEVGGGIYVVTALLNNTTVAVGRDALIVVDNQFTPRYQKIMEKIRVLSDKPIRFLINTHYHYDHTGGNAQFRQNGADIVAHANVVERLRNPPPDPVTGKPNVSAPPDALPNAPYTGNGTTIRIDGVTAELVHPAVSAHTDGDSIVVFKKANMIATNDIAGNHYPNIDVAVGGGIDGTIKAVDSIIGMMNDATKVVPGHGPVLSKADIVAFRAMLQTSRDRIAKAKASGMTEGQVLDANLLADLDNPWKFPGVNASSARFPLNVYRSLP